MTFHDIRFPTDINIEVAGSGAGFNTLIHAAASGYEQRNGNWEETRGSWTVDYNVKDQSTFDALLAFFRARYGMLHTFRFKDYTDYRATQTNIGTGDGSDATWQMRKVYTDSASYTFARPITKPVSGTVTIYLDGVAQTVTTDYSIDYATGIITFVSPPGLGVVITATFQFDCHCRFNIDKLPTHTILPPDSSNNIYTSTSSIEIVEVKD